MISSTGLVTPGPAVVVQAVLDSRAACTTTAGPGVTKLVEEIKIWLKRCDQCSFLQHMLSARIFKSIFDFRICIPNRYDETQLFSVHCIVHTYQSFLKVDQFEQSTTIGKTFAFVPSTHGIFLGFWFLVRNEEKNEIPCQGTRKIRGFFYLKRAPNLSKKVHKKFAKFFPPKKCHIFCKRHTIFDPPNNFYCIFMHQYFSMLKKSWKFLKNNFKKKIFRFWKNLGLTFLLKIKFFWTKSPLFEWTSGYFSKSVICRLALVGYGYSRISIWLRLVGYG